MRMRTAGWWPSSRHARLGRPSPRRGLRITVLAVVMVAAGMTAGSAAAVGQQAASLRLVYSCAFPSGSQPVSTQVTATLPTTTAAGKPIQPTGTGIAVSLSHSTIARLVRPNAVSVTLTAALSTGFTDGSRSATATWQHFTSASTAIPPTGTLRLTTTGTAPAVTAAAAGETAVTVANLSLLLTTRTANDRQASRSATPVVCVPRAGQDTTLGKIAVTGSAPAKMNPSPSDDPAKCLPFPKNLQLNPRFPLPKPIHGAHVFHTPEDACAYAAGFTNAQKLHEAALVGPGLADFLLGQTTYTRFTGITYVQVREPGKLQYHGLTELPPARATLLGFGFVPVSATLQISEIGTVSAAFVSCVPGKIKCPNSPSNFALVYAEVFLSISDVDVNGVPLNVGPDCRTAPFTLKLLGVPPSYNVGSQFGVLTGMVTVPSFTGCHDDSDNLDSIFTASVSGPGNFVKVTQAPFCTPTNGGGCPPAKPHPVH
jgi:hypothetical protein